jgi:phenylpropionate dioxygenase-like ring-hydroxylating dioxygenase large terminal subunit
MALLDDQRVIERVFEHIDRHSTDSGAEIWREPVDNYMNEQRFAAELELLRRVPVLFCPSVAVAEAGAYVARDVAGASLVAVRDDAGAVRVFRNACRHRGMRLADGSGCTKALVCPYHAWRYGLDGHLAHIPHAAGFAGLDRAAHGLVPVASEERAGFVFVTLQPGIAAAGALDDLPVLLGTGQRVFDASENVTDVNWKLFLEANLEGYHIKPTHRQTFYPYGYDNLNVVELFGRNSRVTFPFRRIEKLRSLPPEQRDIAGMVTYVYHLFPNTIVAVLSNHTTVSILEPLSRSQTRFYTYRLTNRDAATQQDAVARAGRDAAFVADTGGKEDAAVVRAIQAGLASGANTHFTYGRYETAIVHFHKTLHGLLDGSNEPL